MNEVNLEKLVRRSFSEGGLDCQTEIVRAKAAIHSYEVATDGFIKHYNFSYSPLRMHYTYILKSIPHPNQKYIGFTSNLKARLLDHNSGFSLHTNKYKPWELEFYCAFNSKEKAVAFERYLKSGSDKAFTKKHL